MGHGKSKMQAIDWKFYGEGKKNQKGNEKSSREEWKKQRERERGKNCESSNNNSNERNGKNRSV
jgi:hypothetical protein